MPGLSINYNQKTNLEVLNEAVLDMGSDTETTSSIIYSDAIFSLAASSHENYPIWFEITQSHVIALEGMIYNISLDKIIQQFQEYCDAGVNTQAGRRLLESFLRKADGDFLLVVYSIQDSELTVANDRLGRLHTFSSYSIDDGFVMSREMKFIFHFMSNLIIDKLFLTQYLMYEYAFGNSAIFKNILRMGEASYIEASLVHKAESSSPIQISTTQYAKLGFDCDETVLSRSEAVADLQSLLQKSMTDRISKCEFYGYQQMIDVSGGYDTRMVLGLYVNNSPEGKFYTHKLVTGDESTIAEKLGELFGREIQGISADHSMDLSEAAEIIYKTDGLVNVWTSLTAWRDSEKKKKLVHGKHAVFMGFGGEFLRHPLQPTLFSKSPEAFARKGLIPSSLDIDWASAIIDVSTTEVRNHLLNYFKSYPEQTNLGKIRRMYHEYYHKLVLAGEDRTRRLFWTVQPLWTIDLYGTTLKKIPLKFATYSFFRDIMAEIDPRMLKVPIFGSSVKLESRFSNWLQNVWTNLYRYSRALVLTSKTLRKKLNKHRSANRDKENIDQIVSTIRDVHSRLEYFQGVIPIKGIESFMSNGYGFINYQRILSILLYLSEVEKRFPSKISSEK
ncbi:MAG: hypothetical protein HQ506_03450 [Candidatus Marinimicrobia bacterium]|nr:hypothetical protein [Candidatus Neomarinimicrobiota bacterium]